MQRIDISNERFGRLVVQEYVGRNKWKCLCDCGTTRIVASIALRRGIQVSCGCYRNKVCADRKRTHGMSRTPIYETWCKMRKRCADPKSTQYKWYGGKGVSVCEAWESFEQFHKDMGDRPVGTTLDRINVDGNYEPSNCRWATSKEQASNTSRSISYQGKSIQQWSEETGIKYATLAARLRKYKTIFPEVTYDH